jgi:FkbM family methyltransferase
LADLRWISRPWLESLGDDIACVAGLRALTDAGRPGSPRVSAPLPPYRFGFTVSFAAHVFKAVVKQHHREQLPILRALIPRDGVVVDVGGHAGQYAKLFARLVPQGHVYTFEPSDYALAILRTAIRLNRLRNVTIMPWGLSSDDGIARLRVPLKHRRTLGFGLSHFGPDASGRPLFEQDATLSTLDAFVASRKLERLDFLKADIEGWELRMLHGAETTLRRFRPPILIELIDSLLTRAGDDLAGAWRFLANLGYRPYMESDTGLVATGAPRDGDTWWLPG